MIDLDRIDKLDKYKDAQQIGKMVEESYKMSYGYLEQLAILWEQNIRFYEGDQYIFYNQTIKNYEPIPVTKYNDFIPRPITNLLMPIEQTMTSLLTKRKPAITVSPNSEDEADELGAKIGDRVLDAKWDMDNETLNHIAAAKMMIITGTVWRKDYWDPNKGKMQLMPSKDKNGNDTEITMAPGDTATRILSPFEVIPDKDSQSWFVETTLEPIWWIKSAYNQEGPGFTGMASKIKEDRDFTTLMSIRYRLKSSTGYGGRGIGAEAGQAPGHAMLKTGYIKPTPNHPKGLWVVVCGGRTLYCDDCPTYNEQVEDSWHPLTWCFWENHPFRFHGISLFENLVPLQKRINAIDSLIILNRMSNVSPQWLIPKNCQIPEGYINGSPGLQIWYSAPGGQGALPQRLPGIGLSGDVWKERQDLVTQMHMIAGDNEVMQGNRPEGVNTLGGLNLLLEQSYSKFSPLIMSWERFIEKGQQKKLLLIADKYKEARPDFVKRLQVLNKDNLEVEIDNFMGMNLQNNLGVRIEAGSSLPKSKAVYQNNLMELLKMGLLGKIDPDGNPIANQQFLAEFGVTKFDSATNADVRRAKFIIGVLKGINEGRLDESAFPTLLPFDDLMLHKKVVTDAMKVPGFKDTKGMFQRKYDEIMTQFQAEMSQQTPPPPPPPKVNLSISAKATPQEIEEVAGMKVVPPPGISAMLPGSGNPGMPTPQMGNNLPQPPA